MTRATDGSGRVRNRAAPVGRLAAAAPRRATTAALGGALLVLLGSVAGLRVANNLPGPLPAPVASAHAALAVAAPTAAACLVGALGVVHRQDVVRAGLVFAGTFALVGLHVPAAAQPAVVVVVGGVAAVVVGLRTGRPGDRATGVAVVVWAGLALSLGAATGLLDAVVRSAASTVALAAIALLPVALPPTRGGWVGGGLAAAAVLWAGAVAPFVTGAAVLVGVGALGVPLVLVAAAAGGGVAAGAGAMSRHHVQPALAAGLLVAAGVPATMPRALAAGAALALLAEGEPP